MTEGASVCCLIKISCVKGLQTVLQEPGCETEFLDTAGVGRVSKSPLEQKIPVYPM